ncbi:CBS domain-containing protein [Peribacillus sp. NPDC097206]|uniref:CBS domain-containing protein n=1 Tax=Peribacillus sp. NPDC097206 TaxID=3364398 RepID=UPI0038169939
MLVKDYMIKEVYVARPNFTLKEIMGLFIENKVGGVPVVDDQDKLLGMVSDGDILRYLAPAEESVKGYYTYITILPGENLDEKVASKMNDKVSQIIKNKKITKLSPEDPLSDLIKVISKHHFKKIPVVDERNKVVGIISRGDALRALYKEFVQKL